MADLKLPPAGAGVNEAMCLTPDQQRAKLEIAAAFKVGGRHLLTGYAGSGKTTLMDEVARDMASAKRSVVMTAPTHKAVQVLSRKLQAAGVGVPCQTIHSLLGLQPYPVGPKTKLKRRKGAKHVTADVVIVDECSMVDSELLSHIDQHLKHVFVLYVGDPAQLPPVDEKESQTFAILSRSHLATVVRQAASSPVLKAAHTIRASQGGTLDMTWCKRDVASPFGVYLPNGSTDTWMEKAFTSTDFAADNDVFRYLCWTNARVAEVNQKVRRWLYGVTTEPFSIGERVLIRQPIFAPINPNSPLDERKVLFNTNEEAPVSEITPDVIEASFKGFGSILSWRHTIPAWRVTLEHPDGSRVTVKTAKRQEEMDSITSRIVSEAKEHPARWRERHEFLKDIGKLQSVYALTCHNSQGSTFKNVFVDVGDILRRSRTNLLEAQQMMYVAATRPTHALMLVNAGDRP